MRYFFKRAYFLANVAAVVRRELPEAGHVSFVHLNDNPLLPVLALDTPGGHTKEQESGHGLQERSGYRIYIIPVAPEGLFPDRKLSATSNCVRPVGNEEHHDATLPATPFYNSTLKAESRGMAYLRLVLQAGKDCRSFADCCILGRIWLQQRGFDGRISKGGFGNFEWSVLVATLLQSGNGGRGAYLSRAFNSAQLFKAVIRFLAGHDFREKPFILGDLRDVTAGAPELGPVLYDATRQHNVAYKMTAWSAGLLRQHAQWTHSLLCDEEADQFNLAFRTRADDPLHMFDLVLRVRVPETPQGSVRLDRRGLVMDFSDELFTVTKKALGNRAKMIHIQPPEMRSSELSASQRPPSPSSVLVGVVFDPSNMTRKVDHGPAAEDKQAAKEFHVFWGSKAELRRFKDGSIEETLIWTEETPFDICAEIIRYILHRKMRLQPNDLEFTGQRFSSLVPLKETDNVMFSAARMAFEQLENDVRGLADLPLEVRQLAAVACELRSASLQPPVLDSPKGALHPMEVVIYFEASGKWPDHLAAIQRAKIAFLLKIGSSLAAAHSNISTAVGLEDPQVNVQNLAFLDVLYEGGAAFRLRVHSDLEEAILERQVKDGTLEQYIRADSAHHLATLKRLCTHLPAQNRTISTLCTRFPALSSTIRLLKRWLEAQKLAGHFTPEFAELAALHAFLQPYPWSEPSSAMMGFLRTLVFLSRWDWRHDPLFVDPAGALTADDRRGVRNRLEGWRKIDPNLQHTVLVVASSHDSRGTAYTTTAGEPLPSRVVAARMTTLAAAACHLVRERGIDLDPRALFAPALAEFDILIRLDARAVKAVLRDDDGAGRSIFKNLDARTGRALRPVARHPVATLLALLKRCYGSGVAAPLVFFGGEADTVIAAVWNPLVHRRSFRVNLHCAFRPVGEEGRVAAGEAGDEDEETVNRDVVEVDRDAILAEIARIGGALIEKVEVVKK